MQNSLLLNATHAQYYLAIVFFLLPMHCSESFYFIINITILQLKFILHGKSCFGGQLVGEEFVARAISMHFCMHGC